MYKILHISLPHYAIFTAIFLLSSCQLQKNYEAPLTPTPTEWKTDSPVLTNSPSETFCHWWEVFEDPTLNQLEVEVLNSNQTLKAALQKVIQARSTALAAKASLYPQINLTPSYTKYGMYIENQFTGLIPQLPGVVTPIPKDFRIINTEILMPLDVSYQVDLWKQLSNQYNADLFLAQATTEDYFNILLTLTSDLAIHYFAMRDLDAQQQVLHTTITSRQKALDINRARFSKGLIAYLDVTRAEVELARAESDSIEIRRLRSREENVIATLMGTPASLLTLNTNPLHQGPPEIPTILPSDLLSSRPDIIAAERKLASAYANIGVAYAAFFPSLNLNVLAGFETPIAARLFDWKARFWQLGASVVQMVFDGGRNEANLVYARAKFEEQLAQYQEQVLSSFQEVEDALVSIQDKQEQWFVLKKGVKSAKETLKLSQERYDRGLVNYLDVVDAERTLLEIEQTWVIILGDRYLYTINLIKALGGTWSYQDDCYENCN